MHNKATDELSLTEAGLLRLENWQAWATNGEAAMILRHSYPRQVAACALYRSTEHYTDEDGPSMIVDPDDAARVDRALCQMPQHLKTAVTNKYIGRPRILNIPYDVLEGWVSQAARMLQERWP
jgi:hypothetical protein